MARGEQIDKISKKYVRLTAKDKKFQKREHKRYLRRLRKKVNEPTPQNNRYKGWIG